MRQFCVISASFLLLAGLLLGCRKPAAQVNDDKKDTTIAQPVVKIDNNKPNGNNKVPVQNVVDPKDPKQPQPAIDQDKYEAAVADALTALAERKWSDALASFELAKTFNDTEFVQSEILKLRARVEQDAAAKATLKNIETVLNDGKPEEAVKLANEAVKAFGDGDDADKLVTLRLQADALASVQAKEGNEARFTRFSAEAATARKEENLRAEVLALELALQAKDDPALKDDYDKAVAKLEKYDTLRKKAAELRRDNQPDEALAALQEAAKAWNTAQVRGEIDECTIAKERPREAISVANFDVRNDVGMPDAGAALADELLPNLKSKYHLVERGQLNRVIAELKLQNGFADDLQQQQQFSKLARVRYLVVGSISRRTNVSVKARIVDLRTGLIVQTAGIVAPTMEAALERAPELAKQLLMSDEDKLQQEAIAPAGKVEVAPDNAAVPPAPLAPQAEALPPPILDVPPPQFGAGMQRDAFKVLAPAPAGAIIVEPEPLVVQKRNRLLFATIELGDFFFRAGRFRDAQRQFEFALQLAPDHADILVRLERVRPLAPPVVVVAAPQPVAFVKPRLAVLPFATWGKLPPSLGYWTPTNLAPYFSARYDVVDPSEIYWYMGRMGMTMQDLMNDPNARRWLGRAVGVRYFVLGSHVETTSFDVNTYLVDAELGYLQGGATINVRNTFELKLRLAELAELTMMTPAERQAYLAAQQHQRFLGLVADGRRHMDQRRYRDALRDFGLALQTYPNNVQVRMWFQMCEAEVRLQDQILAIQQRQALQQAQVEAARQRQLQLAREAELARRNAIAIAATRTDAEKKTLINFRFQARDAMVTQAQVALKTKRFGLSVSFFQGAMDVAAVTAPNVSPPAPVPVAVYQDFAQARREAELAEHARQAQLAAAREAAIRQERDKQLLQAQQQIQAQRAAEKARLEAIRTAQLKRDKDAFDEGIKQGQRFMTQNKYEAALAAFQAAQRVAHGFEQNKQVNNLIEIIVQRQAEAAAKTAQEKEALEARLKLERDRRKAAETLAQKNEEAYTAALLAAQQALAARNLDVAQTKFEEARLLYKTDAVLTGLAKVQAARAALLAEKQKADAEAKKADTIKKLIADGNTALAAQKYADAVLAFQQAKKLAPSDLAVLTGLTRAEQGRDRLLAEERRKAEESGRTLAFQRLLKTGRDNLAAKQFEAAVANFTEAAKLNPTDASVKLDLDKAIKGRDAALTDAKAKEAAKVRAEKYQKLMTDGQAALDSKRWADAIKYYSDAQKLLPGDKTSLLHLQEAQVAKKAGEDAVIAAAKKRADDMKRAADVQKALTQGRLALAGKDFTSAKKLFDQAKALTPTDPDVLRALRDLDQAVQRADAEAIAQKQRLQQFQTALAAGKTALNAKKYVEALKALSSATTLMPDSKEAQDLFRRAQTEARLAEEAAAKDKALVAQFQTAVNDGQKAFLNKNYDVAIKSFQAAVKLRPTDVNAQKLLQQAQDAQKFATTTAANFQKALNAGQLAMTNKKYADAVKAFTDATKLDPNDARARKLLQSAQQALTDANAAALALANYQKSMTTGQTAMTAKRYADAVAAYKDALKWMPKDLRATQQLQAAQQALTDSTKTKTPDPGKAFIDAMKKGEAAQKDKRYADAVKAYQEALKARPKDAEAIAGWKQAQFSLYLWQGQQYLNNAMWMAAQNQFEAALNIFPNDDEAKKLLQKAKAKKK